MGHYLFKKPIKNRILTNFPLFELFTDITTSVTAVSGSKALLQCNITPPTEDDAASLILWYKDESTTPIYR